MFLISITDLKLIADFANNFIFYEATDALASVTGDRSTNDILVQSENEEDHGMEASI